MSCIGCKFYDASVDACNADEHCYQEGYNKAIELAIRICNEVSTVDEVINALEELN